MPSQLFTGITTKKLLYKLDICTLIVFELRNLNKVITPKTIILNIVQVVCDHTTPALSPPM